MSFLWSVKAAVVGVIAFQLLRFRGLFLCSPLSFSLCPVSLGHAVLEGAEIIQVSICHTNLKSHVFRMPKFMYGVRLCMTTPVLWITH